MLLPDGRNAGAAFSLPLTYLLPPKKIPPFRSTCVCAIRKRTKRRKSCRIGNAADYSERFKMILTQQTELKAKRVELERQQAEDAELNSHMEEAADIMGQAGTAITEWNERNIRDLVESVRILSKEKILVRLKSGIEKTEKLQS